MSANIATEFQKLRRLSTKEFNDDGKLCYFAKTMDQLCNKKNNSLISDHYLK